MDQTEAMKHLQALMHALQRYRSIIKENMTGISGINDEMLATLYPWIFGTKCPLIALQKVLDRGSVNGSEFYNFMYIVHRFIPEIKIVRLIETQEKFPEPDTNWIMELGL